MGTLILFNLVSIDGYFAAPGGELDWHNVDEEFQLFAIEQLDSAAALLFGRVTYQLMAAFWPSPEALKADPQTAARMNSLPKYVVSRTLKSADWNNTQLLKRVDPDEIRALRDAKDKHLFLLGSAELAASLAALDLIDEYRVMVNPIALGGGLPLFRELREPRRFDLIAARTFRNGNVLLYYRPVRA